MSRSAHAQSTYKLRKLPRCTKCKTEFFLVMSQYENAPQPVWEWECPKCHKAVPKNLLTEEALLPEDVALTKWCEDEHKRIEREQNSKRALRPPKRRRTKSR